MLPMVRAPSVRRAVLAATGGYPAESRLGRPAGARDIAGPRQSLNHASVHSGAIRGVWGNVHPAVSAVRETPHLTLVRRVHRRDRR